MSMLERDIAIASSKQLLSFANDELFIVNKNCKMEEVTEEEIFKIFVKKDQNSRMMPTIADCVMMVNEEYDIIVTDEQRKDIKKSLKNYAQLKKRHFTEKRIAVNWDKLSCMGSVEKVVLCYPRHENSTNTESGVANNNIGASNIHGTNTTISSLTGSSRKRPLEQLGSRKQVLRKTDGIWAKIQAVAAEENVTASQLLEYC